MQRSTLSARFKVLSLCGPAARAPKCKIYNFRSFAGQRPALPSVRFASLVVVPAGDARYQIATYTEACVLNANANGQ